MLVPASGDDGDMTTDPASGATPGPDPARGPAGPRGAGADDAPHGSGPHHDPSGPGRADGAGRAPGPESPLDRVFATLHRSPVHRLRGRRVIGGVASGVAQYFGLDPVLVRVGFVVLAMIAGLGLSLYLLAWLLLPDEQGSVHLERAVRERDKGSIVLGVVTAVSLLDGPDGQRGWWPTVTSVVVTAALVAFVVHRMRRRGQAPGGPGNGPGGSGSVVSGAGGTAPGTPVTGPGAHPGAQVGGYAGAHGSPTRGGDTSVFDPITGRWVPAVAPSRPAAPPATGSSPYGPASSAAPGHGPATRPESPQHPGGGPAGAAWPAPPGLGSWPGSGPGTAGWADPTGYPTAGAAPAPRRPRLGVTATLLTLIATATVGVGAAYGVQAAAVSADTSIVGIGAALGFLSIIVFVLGMRGVRATALAVVVLLLVPMAAGVARLAPAPGSQTGVTIQVGPR